MLIIPAAAALPDLALPINDYPEYWAIWSLDCKNLAADNVRVDLKSVTVTHKGVPISSAAWMSVIASADELQRAIPRAMFISSLAMSSRVISRL